MPNQYSYLTALSGERSGTNFLLDPKRATRLGRGMDNDIVLTDPLSSRFHAELICEQDGAWWLVDADSRNGSFVNDEPAHRVQLKSGDRLRLGSSVLQFQIAEQPPTLALTRDTHMTESIVKEAQVDSAKSGHIALAALRHADHGRDLVVLYQLAMKLLGCDEPRDVIRNTLELIHDRTEAAVVGFLWFSEDETLKPKMVVPEEAGDHVILSESLTQLVVSQNRAIWIANQASAARSESLRQYADALCVPLIHDQHVLGALHMYLGQGSFREVDFEFAISVAHVLATALARSRRQATMAAELQRLEASSAATAELLGESPSIQQLKETISKVAKAQGCVLIRGESGSGKELVAKALHGESLRSDRPLLAVNCAAFPAHLVESELFGHVKGAFTGAEQDRMGWFQQADTGTLMLDEIGELPLEAQAKLLRILEGHAFQAVGGSKDIRVDVRILAATNRDLHDSVRKKEFREDLYYRLSVFEIRVPPLRDREGDVELLLDHFWNHFTRQHGRTSLRLSDPARQRLITYAWPGNVRQLRNVIDSAVVMASDDIVAIEDLGLYDVGTDELESLKISDWERRLIRMALQRAKGSVPDAAKLLGIGRATLYRKIEEYKIERA